MPDFDKTFENEISYSRDQEIYKLKKEMAIKVEEIQALYLEIKSVRKLEEDHQKLNGRLRLENKHLKQQIKQLEEEQEELLNYP
jgi:regulator of replication initiation timing